MAETGNELARNAKVNGKEFMKEIGNGLKINRSSNLRKKLWKKLGRNCLKK